MAPPLIADASIADVESALAELRSEGSREGAIRTSVLTHIAWVPEAWERQARDVLSGLAERHPSRTILLHPDPDAEGNGLDAEVDEQRFDGEAVCVAAEVVRIRLRGSAARAPASVVAPLVLPDLPVFLRWRGLPEFGSTEFAQLTRVADRLIVDSTEWPEPSFAGLIEAFERIAVSDLAWRRTFGWRVRLAGLWPEIGNVRELHVVGPRSEGLLLAGWLRSRLGREITLQHADADEVDLVVVDGATIAPPVEPAPSPSDLLSEELEVFSRDPIYEDAVRHV